METGYVWIELNWVELEIGAYPLAAGGAQQAGSACRGEEEEEEEEEEEDDQHGGIAPVEDVELHMCVC
jgi:hypothetical protein